MEVLFSTVSALAASLEKKNGDATLEADYKTADISKMIPGLTPDGMVDFLIGPDRAGRFQFTTPDLLEGLVRISIYEQLHALVLTEYDELIQTFGKCVAIIGYDDQRGFSILDGSNARVTHVGNLEFETKAYFDQQQIDNGVYKFIVFLPPPPQAAPVATVKQEVVSAAAPSPKKKTKVVKKKVAAAPTAPPSNTPVELSSN